MNNIVFVNFECNESTKVVAQKIWQYDYGQILRIQGLNLPAAVEIHFSLQKTGGAAKRRIGVTRDGVTDVVIPDFILTGEGIERDYTAYAFIYLSTEESGQTEHRIELNIKSRPEPEGSSGSDEPSFGAIMDAIKTFAAGKADGLKYENSILKLMSGETELARVTIKAGEGTGSDAREIELQKSDTAIQWRYVGDEEWTDLVLLEELKGEKGDPGEGGKTAYQYAQDGGYTGTEEEFAKKLAQENPTREEFSQLSDTIDNLKISGLTTAQVNSLNGMFKKCAFTSNATTEYEAFKSAFGITESGGEVEPDIPDEPDTPVVTLTSISATYIGGEVATGTALTELKGVTVKAHYSDGTYKTVTGYTLSGEILEGENIITVSYSGKTTTFTVTGVVESGGGDVTAELITDGLLDYFDLRTCEYNNEGAGSTTLIQPTQGNGQLYTWTKNAVTEQNEYGVDTTRQFMYDVNGGTNQSDLGTEFTIVSLVRDGIPSDVNGANGVMFTTITPSWKFDAQYNTSTGTGRTSELGSGNNDIASDYNFHVKRVDGNYMKVVFDTSSIELDGGNYDGFVSWNSKPAIATVYNNGTMIAWAFYNRALTDVEIEEMRAFFKTLEVA